MRTGFIFVVVFGCLLLHGCSPAKKITGNLTATPVSRLVFRGEYDLPHGLKFRNTTVGGLSGIDYDPAKDLYYMICDDPGAYGPSRFYTARIFLSAAGIDSVTIIDMTPLLNTEAKPYSDIRADRTHSLDGEALRYNAATGEMIYSSEGQRYENKDKQWLIQNPTIYAARQDGSFKDSFELPGNMYIRNTENGPRHNSVFEGLTFTEDHHYLFVSVEEPVYEDGPRAATGDSTGWVRFLKFDMHTRKQVAQYAYPIDAVPYPPIPAGAFKINGVSDILYAGNNRFIVIERAFMTGRVPTDIRVYLADAGGATDISPIPSVQALLSLTPVKKKLLINMEVLGRHIDNIEGVTFGPVLPNGHQSLLFVADDNFSITEKGQFFLFEIVP